MSIDNQQPHIQCRGEDAAPYALLPGDPQRVERIKPYLENVRDIAYNREYKSIAGTYKGVRVMAVSTGIGGPSAVIAVEELYNLGVRTMIRIGSCGALQSRVRLGDLVIVNAAVRNDGASDNYISRDFPAVADTDLLFAVLEAARELGVRYHVGLGRAHDGFYIDAEEEISSYWSRRGVLGSDMETAALFVVARLRGIRAASILNNVVENNGSLQESINLYSDGESLTKKGEENEILVALEAIVKMDGYSKP